MDASKDVSQLVTFKMQQPGAGMKMRHLTGAGGARINV